MAVSIATAQPAIAGDVGAGNVLGRYELLMPIAAGGMAMVWAARLKGSRGFQKIVAIKTMLPKLSEDASFEQMFLDEASLASQVRHPHVVEIMDLGEQDAVLFLVMEWIDGVPLNQLIKAAKSAGGVPLPVAVRICMQACAGLNAAHELRDQHGQLVGLVHRDVSPQNILVTYDGVTKVVDFGVAKATAVGGGATAAGQVKGKVAYMAPEQIKGANIDRRVDVFAMGVVLYTLTTGRHPFRKDSEAATLYEICSPQPAVSPRKIVPGYPLALERVLMQALAKDPARRYPTANDLQRALDQALPSTMRVSTDEEVAKFVRGLMAEKREAQKAQLQQALDSSDQRAASKVTLRQYLDSQPPPSLPSSVSDVSAVTHSGGTPSGAVSVAGLDASRMGSMPELTPSNAAGAAPSVPRRRTGVILAASLALVALVAVAAVVLMRAPGSEPVTPATPVAAAPAAPPVPPPKAAEPEPREPAATAVAATAPPADSAEPVTPTKRTRPKAGASKPSAGSAPGSKPTPKPAAQPGSTWKQDPGF